METVLITVIAAWLLVTTEVSAASARAPVASARAVTPVLGCLSSRPLRDVSGRALPSSALHLQSLSVPTACEPVLCSSAPLTLHTEAGVTYAAVSVDARAAAGAQCLQAVSASEHVYRRAGVPLLFLPAGDVHLAFVERSCSAGVESRERLLLLAALRAEQLHPLQAVLLCQPGLQATPPATAADSAVTHLTLYSGQQARSAPAAGFAPQYARLSLSDNLVVSVMSSCVGGPGAMELVNELAAAWPGQMDSCLRLFCRAGLEALALGEYRYVVYSMHKSEAQACFTALQRGGIGSEVATPLTQVRVLAGGADSCSGRKVMVLNPAYTGSSAKLQRFLYYQAYKIHSFRCPASNDDCLRRRLTEAGLTPADDGAGARTLPKQCSVLVCDPRVLLIPTGSAQTAQVLINSTEQMALRPLNNACVQALRREGGQSAEAVSATALGVSLMFSAL